MHRAGHRYCKSCLFAGILVGLAGCGHFWDDFSAVSPEGTARSTMNLKMQLLFQRPDPLDVLAHSKDGDLRARAYAQLKEPKEHGGNDEEQDRMVEVLGLAARSEKHTVCRLAAVEKLGSFKDPRATKALTDAFYAPANFGEKNPVVRMAALQSLGQRGDADALQTLTEAVSRDPSMSVRVTAAKALAGFQQDKAAEALLQVLRDERDVALRHEAATSLKQITGRDAPADAEAWSRTLQEPAQPQTRSRLLSSSR